MEKTPILRTTESGRVGGGSSILRIRVWPSTQVTSLPPTPVARAWAAQNSHLASHGGRGGVQWDLQKAEPEGAIRGRGQEEAASTAFPGKGASLWSEAVWLTAKHRPGQDKPGREPTEAQATRDAICYPPVHQQSPTWAPGPCKASLPISPTLVLLLILGFEQLRVEPRPSCMSTPHH